jgi:hypothetical protein
MNKFNRILLASGLAATASLVANSPAFAGTTGKVDLSGTVPSTLAITVTPSANATSLSMNPGNTYSNVKIGTLTGATTNSTNGLKVVLTSSSNWRLTSGSNFIPITVISEAQGSNATSPTKDNITGSLGGGGHTLSVTNTSAAGSATDSSIFISYDVFPDQAAGTYTGSITFTASDK